MWVFLLGGVLKGVWGGRRSPFLNMGIVFAFPHRIVIKIENMTKFFVNWKENVLNTAEVFRSLHSHQVPETGPKNVSSMTSPNNSDSSSFSPNQLLPWVFQLSGGGT